MKIKTKTLFTEMYILLQDNVIPDILNSLKSMGMNYAHLAINAQQSMCFFNYLETPFPFAVENMTTIKDEAGNNIPVLILNLSANGKISISDNMRTGENGLTTLGNTVPLFDHFSDMFGKFPMENHFLFYLSLEFTKKSEQLKKDITHIEALLENMKKIIPTVQRNVITEKDKKKN